MLTKSQKEISRSLEDIMDRSVEKIQKLKIKITSQIESFFFTFEIKFKEEFKREIQSFLQLSQQDLQTQIPKLKEQLLVKFEKLENMQQILSEFKVSPNFVPVDPLMKVPHQYQVEKQNPSAQQLTDEPLMYISYQHCDASDSPTPKKKIKKVDRTQTQHQCPQCQESFKQIFEYRAHLSVVHNLILRFQCPECDFFTNDYFRLSPHLLDKHSFGLWQNTKWSNNKKEIKTYECKKTSQRFQSRQQLSCYVKENMNYHRFE